LFRSQMHRLNDFFIQREQLVRRRILIDSFADDRRDAVKTHGAALEIVAINRSQDFFSQQRGQFAGLCVVAHDFTMNAQRRFSQRKISDCDAISCCIVEKRELTLEVTGNELKARRKFWKKPAPRYTRGLPANYACAV